MLSRAAKCAVGNDHRRALGYHTAKSDSSLNIYSRDAVAPAPESLTQVVEAVKEGTFDPDQTRSGRFRVKEAVAESGRWLGRFVLFG